MIRKLLQEIESVNRRHGLIQKNDTLAVAVSAGPDSVALLELLLKLRRKYCLQIAVLHLDHRIDPKESRRFLSFVQKMAHRLDLPFYSKSVAVRRLARKRGESLEETGRNERYRFFETIASQLKAKIVTAHTLDDQIETLLLRIFRGTGLKGLAGIPAKRKQGRCILIRPLLSCEKKDLLAYLKKNRIRYLVDRSNKENSFTRNRVRNDFLPKLSKQFNPNIKQSLSSLQSICRDTQDFLEKVSERAFRHCQSNKSGLGKISLKIAPVKKLHPAIIREVLLRAIQQTKCNLKHLSSVHIEAILNILNSAEKKELHLPGNVVVKKSASVLVLEQ